MVLSAILLRGTENLQALSAPSKPIRSRTVDIWKVLKNHLKIIHKIIRNDQNVFEEQRIYLTFRTDILFTIKSKTYPALLYSYYSNQFIYVTMRGTSIKKLRRSFDTYVFNSSGYGGRYRQSLEREMIYSVEKWHIFGTYSIMILFHYIRLCFFIFYKFASSKHT